MVLAAEVGDEVQLGSSVEELPGGTARILHESRQGGFDLYVLDAANAAGENLRVAGYEIAWVRKYPTDPWQSYNV